MERLMKGEKVLISLFIMAAMVCLGNESYRAIKNHDRNKDVNLALVTILSQAQKSGRIPNQTGINGVAVNSNVVGLALDEIDPGTILIAPAIKKTFSTVDDINWRRYRYPEYWSTPCGLVCFNQKGSVITYEHPDHKFHGDLWTLYPDFLTPEKDSPALRR